MPTDEQMLLAQIAAGDQQALKCLYARYRQRLWSYLYHQLQQDASRTEEAVQDVFLAVWRAAANYRGEAQVGTWLFRIAHNLALNARRQWSRRPQEQPLRSPEDSDFELVEQNSAGLVHAYDSPEEAVVNRLMLQQALDQLSPHHREILDLAFYQGFSIGEIAVILSIPEGTVKSRMSYARQAFSAHLRRAEAQTMEELPHE